MRILIVLVVLLSSHSLLVQKSIASDVWIGIVMKENKDDGGEKVIELSTVHPISSLYYLVGEGDIIYSVNNNRIYTFDDMHNALDGISPGETVNVAISKPYRDPETYRVTALPTPYRVSVEATCMRDGQPIIDTFSVNVIDGDHSLDPVDAEIEFAKGQGCTLSSEGVQSMRSLFEAAQENNKPYSETVKAALEAQENASQTASTDSEESNDEQAWCARSPENAMLCIGGTILGMGVLDAFSSSGSSESTGDSSSDYRDDPSYKNLDQQETQTRRDQGYAD